MARPVFKLLGRWVPDSPVAVHDRLGRTEWSRARRSQQKFLYLPEEHNDFIFSVTCEELGFIGAAVILILFAMLILRGYWIALHCRDRFSFLVCAGITTLLAIQVFLNVAVVTNLVPCTGISLPLFSYGGTALLIQLGELGIVLSASRDILET